jgi:hypothetical protein
VLEEKRLPDHEADQALSQALRGRQGQLTRADAIAASGLPAHVVESSLERLLKRYKSHLAVTEEGELLYAFDPAMRRRDEPSFEERLRAGLRVLSRVGMWLFKAWIAVTLIAYLVLFVLLLLAYLFGSSNQDDRDDRPHTSGLGMSWLWWYLLPDWGFGYRAHDPFGRPQPLRRAPGRPKKKLIASVFDFVFGPKPPAEDALKDEREVVAYLRAHQGRLVATDLVRLFGFGYTQAEEEVTRLLVDYEGEPEVTSDGVLVYSFPKLLKSTDDRSESTWRTAWQRLEPRPLLTGNPAGTDTLIGAFAGFNLLASWFAASWAQKTLGLSGPTASLWLTGFPLAFFALFLSIPILRLISRRLADPARVARNRQRQLLEKVLGAKGAPLADAPGMHDLALALEGRIDADEQGARTWSFPRPSHEEKGLAEHLALVDTKAEKQVGAVVFSAGEDDKLLN